MAKKTTNRIPRNATKLDVEFLIDVSSSKAGEHMTAEKTLYDGWVGKDKNGKKWSLFLGMLRNENVCKITVMA